jgi:hypothetical protein
MLPPLRRRRQNYRHENQPKINIMNIQPPGDTIRAPSLISVD